MSGHNKWSKIQHKKGAADAARGAKFTKVIREIMVAAKNGGGEPDHNPRLRTALLAAKDVNMPKDNIERAIKKGTGELEGVEYVELTYEGYGPGGVAIVLDCLTDNKNRTIAEVRHAFSKSSGKMAEAGSVAYQFKSKGVIEYDKEAISEEELMDKALEAGAEDLIDDGDSWTVITEPSEYLNVRTALENDGFTPKQGEVTKLPDNKITVEGDTAEQVVKLLSKLEELDDVQKLYSNVDFSEETLTQLAEK